MKAIFADEVQAGDIIIPERGASEMGVVSVGIHADGGCDVVVVNPKTLEISMKTSGRNAIFGLVRRPYPEGLTLEQARERVGVMAERYLNIRSQKGRTGALDNATDDLREALEAYELGLPEEPQRNKSLIDRHMTP